MLIATLFFVGFVVFFFIDLKRWFRSIHPTDMTNEQRLFHIVVKK